MTGGKRVLACLAALLVIAAVSAPAEAGLLDTGQAYVQGTAGFNNPSSGLSGTIEFAVFARGVNPFSGFAPPSDEFTYVYRLLNTGSVSVSDYGVAVNNPGGNIGAFLDPYVPTGDAPIDNSYTVGGFAEWVFSGIVPPTGSSRALVYTSPFAPIDTWSIVVNHGSAALATPVPAPSNVTIPEPSAAVLILAGLAGFGLVRVLRRRT